MDTASAGLIYEGLVVSNSLEQRTRLRGVSRPKRNLSLRWRRMVVSLRKRTWLASSPCCGGCALAYVGGPNFISRFFNLAIFLNYLPQPLLRLDHAFGRAY